MKTLSIAASIIVAFALSFYLILPISAQHKSNLIETETNQTLKIAKTSNTIAATKHIDSIVLGAGCFWGAEKRYQAIPGVITAVSGYAGGINIEPSYQEITKYKYKSDPNNHAEVVKVTYNSSIVSLEKILMNYFEGHDPTQLNRQGNDIGTQYRSTILTTNEEQLNTAQKITKTYQSKLSNAGFGKITTKIEPLTQFFPAEEYHQDYLVKNPNGYCPDHSTGVKFNPSSKTNKTVSNSKLLHGKQIIVIESENYCPYCEKFREKVANDYQGTIPLTFRLASQLQGLEIKTATWATPTILFVNEGKEVFGRQGYMSPEDFYKALGAFKLGESESYNVAFKEGTDGRFCKQYEIFKDTPDGYFVDKLSGIKLFDTRDRFDSKSGWLSFTKAIDGSTYQKQDLSYGMSRIEIRSKSSNIHLGHVFPDGPNGQDRYCINATVLEFVAR